MEKGTRTRHDRAEEPGTLVFAAFVLAHAGCDAGMEEHRLDDEALICRCRRCDEVRFFRRGA